MRKDQSVSTSHSGNVPFGDGMNFISVFPFADVKRVTGNDLPELNNITLANEALVSEIVQWIMD